MRKHKTEIISRLVSIQDDFDLKKIAFSGQCFRVRRFEDGSYRFVTGEHILYIRKERQGQFSVSISTDAMRKCSIKIGTGIPLCAKR